MRNLYAARLGILFVFISAAILAIPVHAFGIGIPAFSPSAECNALFAGSAGTGENGVNSASQTAFSNQINTTYNIPFNIPGGAITVSAIALMFSFDVLGIGYVISKLVPASNVNNWLQREYWEVAKSAILIAVVFSVITFISGIGVILNGQITGASATTTGNYISNVQSLALSSENYLCTVNDEANLSINEVAPYLYDIGFLQSVKVSYAGLPIALYGIPWSPVFRSGVSLNIFASLLTSIQIVFLGPTTSVFIDFVLFLIVPIKVFYSTQIIILPFLIFMGLGILLPMGLVMRAIPFIRGIGGTLIAFGIGVAVVWPSILILFNAPVSSYFCNLVGTGFCTITGPTAASIAPGAQNSCPTSSLIGLVCSSITSWLGTGSGSSVSFNGSILSLFPTAWLSIDSLYPGLNLLIQYNLYLIMQFFVLSVLDLMIFYALTDNIARMLGGTIKISLGRKLKLV